MKLIITFHSLDNSGNILSYPTELFHQLLESLSESNIPILSLEQLLLDSTPRGVSLTFDDGMQSLYYSLLPLMRSHQFPAHLFLTTASVGRNNMWSSQPKQAALYDMLTWQQLEDMQTAGLLIDAHSHSHHYLTSLDRQQLVDECCQCNEIIENRLGQRPRYFAYPYGDYNGPVSEYVKTLYKACVTTKLSYLSPMSDVHLLPRVDSYYLQNRMLLTRLGTPLCRSYIGIRNILRMVKGSQ